MKMRSRGSGKSRVMDSKGWISDEREKEIGREGISRVITGARDRKRGGKTGRESERVGGGLVCV